MLGETFILSQDPNDINAIINDADVKPYVLVPGSDGGDLDVTELFEKGRAFAILTMDKKGGAMLIADEDGNGAEAHTFAKKEVRGDKMIEACVDGAFFIMNECGCDRIYGYTPASNRRALAFNEKIGFTRVGEVMKDRGCGIVEPLIEYEMVI